MSIRGLLEDNLERRPGQLVSFIAAFLSLGIYIRIAFFISRTETTLLLVNFLILFIAYILLVRSVISFRFLLFFGIAYRLIFVFSVPTLSDDFYRFFWDGILTLNRINPFAYLPSEIMENPAISIPQLTNGLYSSLNSPDYYTVYPPVCQLVFWISAYVGTGNIFVALTVMKTVIFTAEMASIYLMWHLLKLLHLKRELTLFYILNPLVIIELTGNVHFEALLITFMLAAAWYFHKNNLAGTAIAMSLAILSKLTPFLLLPFFLKRLKIKKAAFFYIMVIAFVALAFWPFMGTELSRGLSSSIGLYFQKFEFNASIFYVIRELGFWLVGYNVIQTAGISLGLLAIFLIVLLALFQKSPNQNIPGIFLWPLFIYLLFSTIVHPWYATPLVAFSIFTRYRFPLLWSCTIFLSYAGYGVDGFVEQSWALWLQYIPVFAMMVYELKLNRDLLWLVNPWREIVGKPNDWDGAGLHSGKEDDQY